MRASAPREPDFGGALYLGRTPEGPVFAPREHGVLVIGPPRSGKTSGIVIPNVLGAKGGVFVASTKPDILQETSRSRRRVGSCQLFDPSGETAPPPGVEVVGWSPVDGALAWDEAVLVAEAMVGASRPAAVRGDSVHWNERAGALLACLLHAAALDGRGVDAVVSAVNRHDGDRFGAVLARNDSELALDLFDGILATDEREQSGIWSTASGVLAAYRTATALKSATRPRFRPESLLDGQGTLYLAGSAEHQHHLAPIVAGVVRTLRAATYRRSHMPGGITTPVTFVLDEVANIAPLHDLPTLVAEGASQGIVTLACLQDLSQARERWGSAADGFLTLFGTKVILPGVGDTRTLEALSLLVGEREVPHFSRTRTRRSGERASRSEAVSTTRVRRLPPDAIANSAPGTALVFVGTRAGRVALSPLHERGAWRVEAVRGPTRRAGRGISGA